MRRTYRTGVDAATPQHLAHAIVLIAWSVVRGVRKNTLAIIVLSCCCLTGCTPILGDEGEWLGKRIGDAADQLRHSGQSELVLSYVPESGVNQHYSIGIGKLVWCPKPPCYENKGGLTVKVERGRSGSTTYLMRFVAVPEHLEIHKVGEATQLVLRKNKDVIELVELR